MPPVERSIKGYELYSWQSEGEWRHALVMGSNRLKTYEEITKPSVAMRSLAELRSQLARLTRGEEIVWGMTIDARLALPPQPMIDEIEKACRELGLNLLVLPQ